MQSRRAKVNHQIVAVQTDPVQLVIVQLVIVPFDSGLEAIDLNPLFGFEVLVPEVLVPEVLVLDLGLDPAGYH